jgi:hypothetical protein
MTVMSMLARPGLIILVLGVYWLPSILARVWHHPDLVPIVLVNALLGWTVVGWVWAVGRLVGAGAAHRLQLAPAGATAVGPTAAAGDHTGWRAGGVRDGDARSGVGSTGSATVLEP